MGVYDVLELVNSSTGRNQCAHFLYQVGGVGTIEVASQQFALGIGYNFA
jgi:hypothetical protein